MPIGWQHPMVWRSRFDRTVGRSRTMLVPKPLSDDYPAALERWEQEGRDLDDRTGFDWRFGVEYHLTGFKGSADTEPTIHPFYADDDPEIPITVTDEDHLHQMLTANREGGAPNPDDYMPSFAGHDPDTLGWCMYETVSEGTPISPVLPSPEALARWLADNDASAFADYTATYEQWLAMIGAGSSMGSAVHIPGRGLVSGVEAVSEP